MASTCVDFWLMAWETKSPVVVMLTTVLEGGRTKCHPYWPNKDQTRPYGSFTVTCTDEEEDGFQTIRKFVISHNDDAENPHEITQVHRKKEKEAKRKPQTRDAYTIDTHTQSRMLYKHFIVTVSKPYTIDAKIGVFGCLPTIVKSQPEHLKT